MRSILRHRDVDPAKQILDIRVDAVLVARSTPIPPAGRALEVEPSTGLTDQRTPGISLARVLATLVVSGANHRFVDSWIRSVTATKADYRDGDLLQVVRLRAAWRQRAPARGPAFLAVGRAGNRVGQTSGVHVPVERKGPWWTRQCWGTYINDFPISNWRKKPLHFEICWVDGDYWLWADVLGQVPRLHQESARGNIWWVRSCNNF